MMVDFCSYNVRGLNNKCAFVKDFILDNKISLIGLLETRVRSNVAKKVSLEVNPRFLWHHNYEHHPGGRIWVGWNPNVWNVSIIASTAQQTTCSVFHNNSDISFVISFIYGLNSSAGRRVLWQELSALLPSLSNRPWVCSGDFNVCLCTSEKQGGSTSWSRGMIDFKELLIQLGLSDLRGMGCFLTWRNSSIEDPKFCKLDRVVVNDHWLSTFPMSLVNFMARGLSVHCPATTSLGINHERRFKNFQFFNHLIEHPNFKEAISEAWSVTYMGDPWYSLTRKLKRVKDSLKRLNSIVGDIHLRVQAARSALYDFQSSLPSPPSADQLSFQSSLVETFAAALKDEEAFLKQKSRVKWLKCGDGNNKFFYNSCKSHWNVNKVLSLEDADGVVHHNHNSIAQIVVSYFEDILGKCSEVNPFPEDLSLPVLSDDQAVDLIAPFSARDIFSVFKKMPKNRSPGPDGFTAEFYIACWDIIGPDVVKGLQYFFDTMNLPRIINSAAICLVPKVQQPSCMGQFRPISCCNVIYNGISKLLVSRIKRVLPSLISPVQSAFVPHRSIGDNILLHKPCAKATT